MGRNAAFNEGHGQGLRYGPPIPDEVFQKGLDRAIARADADTEHLPFGRKSSYQGYNDLPIRQKDKIHNPPKQRRTATKYERPKFPL